MKNALFYMPISDYDEKWGIVCTTAGYQNVAPGCAYPVMSHPMHYNFTRSRGRILNEYQLVYITKGSGEFVSSSCRLTHIKAGTMIVLFPGEWHSYAPSKKTGWEEWWVGFKGDNIDKRVEAGFFSKMQPLLLIGTSVGIESCYQEIIRTAQEERSGYQMLISSIIVHILGSAIFKNANNQYSTNPVVDKINEARMIMRNNIGNDLSPREIALQLNIGYTWFRKNFKDYVGTSPGQYQLQLKFIKAKELLSSSNFSITEIAYQLGFDNSCQFSSFFKSREGITARDYRQLIND